MIDIVKVIDDEILKKPDQYLDPKYRHCWRTSNFGRCYRYQYWYRKGVGMTNPIEQKALRIFRVGDMFHRDIQQFLPSESVEVEFHVDDVYGHCDHVGDGYCDDFKTVGNWAWQLMNKKGFDVIKDKEAYIYQLMAYCYFLEMPVGRLVFIHKDSYSIKTFEFKMEDWVDAVEDELTTLRAYWDKDGLPPAIPRAYGRKDCNYCAFQDSCDSVEKNTAKDRYELSNPKRKDKVF